ncbi:MAG: hypothetical protein E7359_02010 [Clostridiales bacterium]|nr:hypothetical protein [Clostridiales bacterium]
MEYNLWDKEGKWIKKNININLINCLRFTCKNKAHMLFTGIIYPNIYLNNGEKYKPLEEEINYKKAEEWAKKFFEEINDDKTNKKSNNVLKFTSSLYVNLDNVDKIESYKFEKSLKKNGAKIIFKNGQVIKTKLSNKKFLLLSNIFNQYNKTIEQEKTL